MSFLAPFFLIGIGALLVPIIIHMWSKDAKKSVAFGSLRFLKETETRTTRSIMPSQWLLLLIRLLLLTLLVFLLADMQLSADGKRSSRLYVVDQFYQDSDLVANLIDTVGEGVEVRWLADGFPDIHQPISAKRSNYWNLLSDLPSDAACVVVISPLHQKHFTGKRRTIPSICRWIKPPVAPTSSKLVVIDKNDHVKAITEIHDEWSTLIEVADSDQGEKIEITYHLNVGEAFKEIGDVFIAALSSIQSVSMITLKKVGTIDEADWVIWLSDQPHPTNSHIILPNHDILGWRSITNDIFLVPSNLSKEEAIQMELPRKLLDAFVDDLFEDKANDLLTVDTKVFQFKESISAEAKALKDASSYLWILLLITFLAERWLSYKSSVIAA